MQLLYCELVRHYFTDYIEWILNMCLKLSYHNVSRNEGCNISLLWFINSDPCIMGL